jgi:phosphoglycolate phosphatase
MIDTYLFDLDGTLIDTAPEIADGVNDTLRRLGHAGVADEQVRGWIGEGTRALLGKALRHVGVSDAMLPTELARAWAGFELDYAARCGTRSAPYPGALAALDRIASAGLPMAMVTNKEAAFAHRILVAHGLSAYFDVIVAGDTLAVRKPDAAMVQHALQALGVGAGHAVLVGDSAIDVRTARAAGIPAWIVRHGYHHGELTGDAMPDRFLEHFDELAQASELPARVSIF